MVGADLYRAWYPVGERPTVGVSASRKSVNLLEAVTEHVAAEEPIELVYFPTESPDLNPTEEYWKRLKQTLGNRYFGTLAEIRSTVWSALETIDPPGVYQYLRP